MLLLTVDGDSALILIGSALVVMASAGLAAYTANGLNSAFCHPERM
jgi:hypothetical protein